MWYRSTRVFCGVAAACSSAVGAVVVGGGVACIAALTAGMGDDAACVNGVGVSEAAECCGDAPPGTAEGAMCVVSVPPTAA